MKDHNDYLPSTLEIIDQDVERIVNQEWLREASGHEEALNYLYFLRDEVNKRIRSQNREYKKKSN